MPSSTRLETTVTLGSRTFPGPWSSSLRSSTWSPETMIAYGPPVGHTSASGLMHMLAAPKPTPNQTSAGPTSVTLTTSLSASMATVTVTMDCATPMSLEGRWLPHEKAPAEFQIACAVPFGYGTM